MIQKTGIDEVSLNAKIGNVFNRITTAKNWSRKKYSCLVDRKRHKSNVKGKDFAM